MLGAIIGDIVGSRFEGSGFKHKEFRLFTSDCNPTDDSIMSLAVGIAIMVSQPDYKNLSENTIKSMQKIGRNYPFCGYGYRFSQWIFSDHPHPYNSFGNGAAMRVSAAGTVATSLEESLQLAKTVTEVTHNHPEGIKGAQATAAAIYLAQKGSTKEEIKDYINSHFYPMNFTIEEIRDSYRYNEICQRTVPEALECFFEAEDFEDAIRNAVSLGGDADTLAAICGSVAEPYFGIPESMRKEALTYLDQRLLKYFNAFEESYPSKITE